MTLTTNTLSRAKTRDLRRLAAHLLRQGLLETIPKHRAVLIEAIVRATRPAATGWSW